MTRIADTLERQLKLTRHFAGIYAHVSTVDGATTHPEKRLGLMTVAMTAVEHCHLATKIAKRAQCQQARLEAATTDRDTLDKLSLHDCRKCRKLREAEQHIQSLMDDTREKTGTDNNAALRANHDELLSAVYMTILTAAARTTETTMEGDF